jgi:SAM-dependent MidA family methyltransferase
MSAEETIIQKIQANGPLSFHDFMDMALYHPATGYYTSSSECFGDKGDYYTSPYLGSIFGQLIGKQVEEMWRILKEEPFTIIEYGAGNASLCSDILCYLKNNPALYKELTYYIIEKSPSMRIKERDMLSVFEDKVKWINSISEISGVSGCILSNELVDNFAVHLVTMQQELMEVYVDYKGAFTELLRPADQSLKNHLDDLHIDLPVGHRTEINLEAEQWMKEIGAALKKGFVMTIDYGYIAPDLYQKKMPDGTLKCYHKHQLSNNPYQHVGEQDITAHVNFSVLVHSGLTEGLQPCGFTNQSHFLRALGIANYLREYEEKNSFTDAAKNIKKASLLTLLIEMGQRIKVLIQQKGLGQVFLSGMQFPLQLA